MLRLQVDDTALLRDSQVGGRGAVEGELGSGIPQALLGLEGWEMLDFWVRGPSTASGVRDGERDTKTCLGTELRGLGLNDEFLKERAKSRVAWVTA